MCQSCVDEGSISAWLFEVIQAHERVYDDGYGFAHIVIGDCNVSNSCINYCLREAPRQGKDSEGATESFLLWLRTVPETERVPNLIGG